MKDNAKAMVLASFAGDALALGAHWIYDPNRIAVEIGRMISYTDPPPDSFHPNRNAGDFTHYGDQAFLLMQTVAEKKGFDLDHFAQRWQSMFADYDGYRDHATKETIERFEAEFPPSQSGSDSSDLGGAARIAPLVCAYADQPGQLVEAARAQTAMTHNHDLVIEASAFFATAASEILGGKAPIQAMAASLEIIDASDTLRQGYSAGLKSTGQDTVPAIGQFGRMCEIAAAFPSTVHLVARYENDMVEGLVENVMAGGDSAARGLLVGMLLGAHTGIAAIPDDWLGRMKKREEIESFLTLVF
jgi:ADP-ribosylglycohydrolase